MRIVLSGLGGHMGAEVAKLCAEGYRGAELVAGVDYMNWQNAAGPSTGRDAARTGAPSDTLSRSKR